MAEQNRLANFIEKYEGGEIPWDDELPPPELISLAGEIRPGKALDLGCGYGRSGIFLARFGWDVTGVDFVPKAVEEANKRALAAGLAGKVSFQTADVSDLSFLAAQFDLIVDIGCMHSMPIEELSRYRDGVLRLLSEEGYYLLFAHLRDPNANDDKERRWIEDSTIRQLFLQDLTLDRVTYGTTQVQDNPPWHSVWYIFKKTNSG